MYTFSRKDEIDSSFAVVMSIFERKARQFIEALKASNKNLVKTSFMLTNLRERTQRPKTC